MKHLAGGTAVVTGAASGIGLSLATQLAAHGMQVVLADRDEGAVHDAASRLDPTGARAVAGHVDVADAGSVERLADEVHDRFGEVHLLCNNAGVLRPGSTFEQSLEDWQVVLGVNVMGVVHGLRAFVPRMLASGKPCHVLNTASIGGLIAAAHMAAYVASKHAVVAISETLAQEVAGTAMGVTVLCPGGVATQIYRAEVERRRSVGLAGPAATEQVFAVAASTERTDQLPPDEVARIAIDAVRAGELYAFTFAEPMRSAVKDRFRRIESAIARMP